MFQSSDNPPASHHLRLGRWSETFACYAITKCLAYRRPILAAEAPAQVILSSFDYLRRIQEIRLLGFCIMPDHYHALFFLVGGKSLSEIMSSVGKYTANRINALFRWRGQLWEEGFYDHRCRNEDDIDERLLCIEHNPVRAELASVAEQWPFSSAHPSHVCLLDRDWYASVR
jgi:putative transposase